MSGFSSSALNQTVTSWTPVITAVTPGNLSVAYSIQFGSYIKTGKQVQLSFNLVTSTFTYTTASGSILITGLPFAANSTTNISFSGSLRMQGWTRSGYTEMVPFLAAGQSQLTMNVSGTALGTGAEVIGSFPSGGVVILEGSLVYYTD